MLILPNIIRVTFNDFCQGLGTIIPQLVHSDNDLVSVCNKNLGIDFTKG